MTEELLEEARHEYQQKMLFWQDMAEALRNDLLQRKSSTKCVSSIQTRVKSWEQIRTKLELAGRKNLSSLTDIVGLRVVVNPETDIKRLIHQLSTILNTEDLVSSRTEAADDKEIASVHIIGRIRSDCAEPAIWARFKNEPVEIQIRTSTTQALTEVEHEIGYKPSVDLSTTTRRRMAIAATQGLGDIINTFERLIERQDLHEKIDVHPFMAKHTFLLHPNPESVISEVSIGLGTEYKIDFLIREPDGEFIVVEIENPNRDIVTKSGNLSAYVNHAVQQVEDWQEWITENLPTVQRYYPGMTPPRGLVIIGRSSQLTHKEKQKLARRNANLSGRMKIITYDEVVHAARLYTTSLLRIILGD